jgi:hypothetical protein
MQRWSSPMRVRCHRPLPLTGLHPGGNSSAGVPARLDFCLCCHTPGMRHQGPAAVAENADVMGTDEITFEDLLADGPVRGAPPRTYGQLLADGLPREGGMAALSAIAQLPDPGPKLAAVRQKYLEILELQRHAA